MSLRYRGAEYEPTPEPESPVTLTPHSGFYRGARYDETSDRISLSEPLVGSYRGSHYPIPSETLNPSSFTPPQVELTSISTPPIPSVTQLGIQFLTKLFIEDTLSDIQAQQFYKTVVVVVIACVAAIASLLLQG